MEISEKGKDIKAMVVYIWWKSTASINTIIKFSYKYSFSLSLTQGEREGEGEVRERDTSRL